MVADSINMVGGLRFEPDPQAKISFTGDSVHFEAELLTWPVVDVTGICLSIVYHPCLTPKTSGGFMIQFVTNDAL